MPFQPEDSQHDSETREVHSNATRQEKSRVFRQATDFESSQNHRGERTIGRMQTAAEERFNMLSHAMLAGLLVLASPLTLIYVYRSAASDPLARTLAVLVYLICILIMLGSSSFYHALPASSRHKRTLNRIDHISIFLAIAGSYTPIALATLDRADSLRVLLAEWGLAAVGIIFKLSRFRKTLASMVFSIALYLGMGWLVVIYGSSFMQNASAGLVASILIGGLAYTAGVVFYSIPKPRMHNIWHICVGIGVVSHYIGIVFLA